MFSFPYSCLSVRCTDFIQMLLHRFLGTNIFLRFSYFWIKFRSRKSNRSEKLPLGRRRLQHTSKKNCSKLWTGHLLAYRIRII